MTTSPRFGTPGGAAVLLGTLAVATGRGGVVAQTCPVEITPIFVEGDDAPGTASLFETFDRPNLGAGGHVAFAADTDGPSTADDVVFVNGVLIAQEGTPAPGSKGGVFSAFEFFETGGQVNASGEVVFITTLREAPTDQNRAIYRGSTLVALESTVLAGIPGRPIADFGFAGVADDGTVGYRADLSGDGSDDSVIVFGDTALYREGAIVSVLPQLTWDGNFDEIQWNGRGDLIFEGNTSAGSGDMVVVRRLNLPSGPVEELVAQEGQTVEARDGEDFLELILQNALADNGTWALRGNLGVAPSEADAVILDFEGVRAQQGDPVAEFGGVVLGNFNGVDVNSDGDMLYLADLEGAPPPGVDEGIFLNGCLLVTTGMDVPGQGEDVVFTDLGFEDLYLSDDGTIVFAASYAGGDGLFMITPGSTCSGDVDGDAVVDFADLLAVLAAWGPCVCPEDVNGDGVVDFADLLVVLAAWGPCP